MRLFRELRKRVSVSCKMLLFECALIIAYIRGDAEADAWAAANKVIVAAGFDPEFDPYKEGMTLEEYQEILADIIEEQTGLRP